MNPPIKKYQPDRKDILWNTDWGLAKKDISQIKAAQQGLVLYNGRWVTSAERKILEGQLERYVLVQTLAVSVLLWGITILFVELWFWYNPVASFKTQALWMNKYMVTQDLFRKHVLDIDFYTTWFYASVLFSGFLILLGIGLWTFKRWAWTGTIIACMLGISMCVTSYSVYHYHLHFLFHDSEARSAFRYAVMQKIYTPYLGSYSDMFFAATSGYFLFSLCVLLNGTTRTIFAGTKKNNSDASASQKPSGAACFGQEPKGEEVTPTARASVRTFSYVTPGRSATSTPKSVASQQENHRASTRESKNTGAPKISAKAILSDIRSGMDDLALMQKYGLSARQLTAVYTKLQEAGLMKNE